jgi:hypothetical protein
MSAKNIVWDVKIPFYCNVLGDDNLTFVPLSMKEQLSVEDMQQGIREIGIRNNMDYTDDPSIMSSRFWKVGDTYVLGPRPGRLLAKLCCVSKPHGIELNKALLEKTYGTWHDSNFVPILRSVIKTMLNLLDPLRKGLGGKYHAYKAHATGLHEADEETFQQFTSIYNIPKWRILEIESLIESVPSLPYVLVIPEMETLYRLDNSLFD